MSEHEKDMDDPNTDSFEQIDDNYEEYLSASEQTKLLQSKVRRSLRSTKSFMASTLKATHVPDEEVVVLTPWEKFRKYYQIPWLIFFDLLTLICVVTMFFFYSHPRNTYFKNIGESTSAYFLPEEYERNMEEQSLYNHFNFHTTEEVLDDLKSTYHKFHSILKDSTDAFTHVNINHNQTLPMLMKYTYYNESIRGIISRKNASHLSAGQIDDVFPLPPKIYKESYIESEEELQRVLGFDNENEREMFDKLSSIEFIFYLQSYFISNDVPLCLEWQITKSYSIASTTQISVYNRFLRCRDEDTNAYSNINIALFVVVVIVSFVCGIVNLASLLNRMIVFVNLMRKGKVPFRKITKYLHWWYFVAVTANVCNILGIFVIYFGTDTNSNIIGRSIAGLGMFFTTVTFIRHYYLYKRLYFLVSVLRFGLPNAFKVFIGTFPLVFSYALAGTIWFGGHAPVFRDIFVSSVTLICVFHSDDLRNTFNRIYAMDTFTKVLARIYLYSFNFIIFTIVLNIVMVVLQDAYMNLGIAFQTQEKKEKEGQEEEEEENPVVEPIFEKYDENADEWTKINFVLKQVRRKIEDAQSGELTESQEENLLTIADYCDELLNE
eukprot:gene1483-12101_t